MPPTSIRLFFGSAQTSVESLVPQDDPHQEISTETTIATPPLPPVVEPVVPGEDFVLLDTRNASPLPGSPSPPPPPTPPRRSSPRKKVSKSSKIDKHAGPRRATIAERIMILDWMRSNGNNQNRTAQHFKRHRPDLRISQGSLSAWVKQQPGWRAALESNALVGTQRRIGQVKFAVIEDALSIWVTQALRRSLVISGPMLRQQWKTFAKHHAIPEKDWLHLSGGWLLSFKKRLGLKEFTYHGEAGSVNEDDVKAERDRLKGILQGWDLDRVYNEDETGLFFQSIPDSGLDTQARSGRKQPKTRITLHLACNATGTDKRPPLFIGKAKSPHCFHGRKPADMGFLYRYNKKAWMKADIYQEWLRGWDEHIERQRAPDGSYRNILLLHDNFSGHIVPDGLRHITVEKLFPNLTAKVQPLDQGIISNLKTHYKASVLRRAVSRDAMGVAASEVYKINQLEGMKIARQAWDRVKPRTIINCWRHSGIIPDQAAEDIVETDAGGQAIGATVVDETDTAMDDLQEGYDALHEAGLLSNTTLEQILHPEGEDVEVDMDDSEILKMAIDLAQANDNDGDDNDDEDDIEVIDKPVTSAELLAACRAITTGLGEREYAGKTAESLSSALALFVREVRAYEAQTAKQVTLHSFFGQGGARALSVSP